MRKAMVVLLTALLVAPIARAEPGQWCGTVPPRDETYTGDDPRVRVEEIDGTRTVVLVPPGYGTSGRRYPVVWLFHGGLSHEDCFLLNTNLLDFTKGQPDDRQAIVVMPDGGASSAWVDSRDGQLRDETRFLETFIPAIDARYRTLPERAHRAIAGFSAGGFGAMHLAARYPDRFAAAAGISGIVEMKETDWFTAPVYGTGQYWYPAPSTSGWFGDPVTDVVWWRDVDPVALAPNFGGTAVTIFTGNGIPCDERDVAELHTLFPFSAVESKVREWAEHLSEALSGAGVAHTLAARPCGIHTYRWAEAGIHTWWDQLFTLFGRPAPSSFDHRRAVDEFSVWGWMFRADPRRAKEFLDVADASCSGVGLTGSGTTTVTTAPCFERGHTVGLTGAVEPTATADGEGRITFHVDLGPAHQFQQYTPPARALGAAGGYWVSKAIGFRREG